MRRRQFLQGFVLSPLAAAAMPGTTSLAQEFPTRPLRIIVPYVAGSPSDTMGRFMAEETSKRIGQPAIVENRPGAASLIGTRVVFDAPADGHTVLVQTVAIVLNPLNDRNVGYKIDDFAPLAPLGQISTIITVPKSFPANNLEEFVAHVRANPGKFTVGTLGGGTPLNLLTDRFLTVSGLNMVVVQYKGAADGLRGLMTGEIDMHMLGVQLAYPQIQAGALKAIAILSEERHRLLPQVATFKEAGIPEMNATPWVAAFARSATPPAILNKLQRAMTEAVASDAYRQRLEKTGGDVWSPPDLALAIKRDTALWEEDIKRIGARAK
jgi:tripartite-type tricarboxylate transporter receptor subunit TctC